LPPRVLCFSSGRRHTRSKRDWSSDVCSSDLELCTILHNKKGYSSRCHPFLLCSIVHNSYSIVYNAHLRLSLLLFNPAVPKGFLRSEERRGGQAGRCQRGRRRWQQRGRGRTVS